MITDVPQWEIEAEKVGKACSTEIGAVSENKNCLPPPVLIGAKITPAGFKVLEALFNVNCVPVIDEM
jgi:hypothetical protein